MTGTAGVVSAVAVLAAANVGVAATPREAMLVLGPVAAVVLVLLARRAGLTPQEIGFDRPRRAVAYAAGGVAFVAGIYALALTIPGSQVAFADDRYRMDAGEAFYVALVAIPIGTVLLEEVGFRGVLWALIRRDHGAQRATLISSVLFGLWHVLPSLRLAQTNRAVGGAVGSGGAGQAVSIAGVMVFTAIAGLVLCELRRRGGSLLAPVAVHWAANGLAVIITAALFW